MPSPQRISAIATKNNMPYQIKPNKQPTALAKDSIAP